MSIIPEELQAAVGPPTLQVGGFAATVEGYAWELDTEVGGGCMRLWYLSLNSSALQAIRAVWAGLLKGDAGLMQFNGLARNRNCRLWAGGPGSWKRAELQLPQASAHQLAIVSEPSRFDVQREDFVLLMLDPDEAAHRHMRMIRKRLNIPMLPGWEQWLWKRALNTGEAFQLDSSDNIFAWRCEPNVERLKADITDAGLAGELPVPESRYGELA